MKKFTSYKQHTPETCGIACMMMIMHHFSKCGFAPSKEWNLYSQHYRTKATYNGERMRGTLGSAIARGLTEHGLDVSLVHSSKTYLDNEGEYYPPELYEELLQEYRRNIDRTNGAIHVETGVQIDCNMLRRELEKDRLVILQCYVKGDADGMHDHVLHGILLYDYDAEERCFGACDPYTRPTFPAKIKLTDEEIETLMRTPIGRMYISAGQRTENKTP